MGTSQQQVQSFVSREFPPWMVQMQPGPWLSREAASRFESYLERIAVSYLEEAALTEAVDAVLGPGNPATPFIVVGLKQVLDARTPCLRRFAVDHKQELAIVGILGLAVLILAWPSNSK